MSLFLFVLDKLTDEGRQESVSIDSNCNALLTLRPLYVMYKQYYPQRLWLRTKIVDFVESLSTNNRVAPSNYENVLRF